MRRLGVPLLYVLVMLTTMQAKADAITGTIASTGAAPDTAPLATTHDKVATRRIRSPDILEERALPVPPNVLPESIPPTIKSLTRSWFESLRPMIKNSLPSFTTFESGPTKLRNFVRSLWQRLSNSVCVRYWLYRGETVDSVFRRLGLDTGLDKIAYSPKFYTWVTFVNLYNLHNPNNKMLMMPILSYTYSDLAVARMIEAAGDTSLERALAYRLAWEQKLYWGDTKKSGLDVFVLLELHEGGQNIFERPVLNRWYMYMKWAYGENANLNMALVLTKQYNRSALGKMFITAQPQGGFRKVQCVKLETAVGKYLLALSHQAGFKKSSA
ncbi:unnamed protein product [Hyaloperonospora brassicae]|uniref:RxLR effector candidate protein n=1 Tax=Hyaloperonospora brassicae TaxID=162125 RepID=A0AAV0TBU6_HYABA|nr:unnamed protein product [Hyaloperonospora brassicae]